MFNSISNPIQKVIKIIVIVVLLAGNDELKLEVVCNAMRMCLNSTGIYK